MSYEELPHFERPPLAETVLGVQFHPLAGLTNAHLGAYWQKLGTGWPKVKEAPPLKLQFEQFGEKTWAPEQFSLMFTQELSARLQITNDSGDRMIQVQNGRFHQNWIANEKSPYPHYSTLRPEFDRALELFKRFLSTTSEKWEVRLNQWEVTYVNHIPKGELWRTIADWPKVIPALGARAVSGMEWETLRSEWGYLIPPKLGRLHVDVKHGKLVVPAAAGEGPEAIILNLTARGPLGTSPDDLDQALTVGRRSIARAFLEITSKAAQEFWGVKK